MTSTPDSPAGRGAALAPADEGVPAVRRARGLGVDELRLLRLGDRRVELALDRPQRCRRLEAAVGTDPLEAELQRVMRPMLVPRLRRTRTASRHPAGR